MMNKYHIVLLYLLQELMLQCLSNLNPLVLILEWWLGKLFLMYHWCCHYQLVQYNRNKILHNSKCYHHLHLHLHVNNHPQNSCLLFQLIRKGQLHLLKQTLQISKKSCQGHLVLSMTIAHRHLVERLNILKMD